MDKIKKVFSPGSKKDDEVLYGDAETQRKTSLSNTTDPESTRLSSTEGTSGQKESGGVLSQITNPGGKKYDETRFGETATTAGTEHGSGKHGIGEKLYPEHREEENQAHYPGLGKAETAGAVDPNTKLETDPNQKDHTVLRQILNPSGNKRDDVAFGTTAHSAGNKDISDTSRSDYVGGGVGAAGASSTLPERTFSSESVTSNRETSVAGVTSGVGAPIIVGSAANTAPQYHEPQSHVLDRSHPLRDGSGAAPTHINPVGAPEASINQHAAQSENIAMTGGEGSRVAGSHINPVGAPSTANATLSVMAGAAATGGLAASSQSHDHSTLGGTSGISTLGGASGGSTLGATSGGATYTDHSGAAKISSLHPVGTKLDCDGNPVPGYVHHVAGPHSLDMANILDPRIAASPASPTMVLSSNPPTPQSHSSTGVAGVFGGSRSSDNSLEKDRSTSHASSDDHEEKKKTGLLQKILHPKSHKEEKEISHGHSHPSTTVDDHGRNVLHKDPPTH